MDKIAASLHEEVMIQCGLSSHKSGNVTIVNRLSPSEFTKLLNGARVIVSHAGIGTIIQAYKHAKPIILVPRRAELGEHRNDHQLATVKNLSGRKGIYVAYNLEEICQLLNSSLDHCELDGIALESRRNVLLHISNFMK
jgi:UDP-N-acetylglucosamine transferase subunit ALG13